MRTAYISSCEKYRYRLSRGWVNMLNNPGAVLFIGLNPSTADAFSDDPTIRRCTNFTDFLGYRRFYMVNLFAFRATDPAAMKQATDPVGPRNDEFILSMAAQSKIIIACWGNHGKYMDRDKAVLELLKDYDIHALKINKEGSPARPLYLKKSSNLKMFQAKTIQGDKESNDMT